jgi:hypothetical protein
LKLRTTRASQQRLRDFTALIQHRERQIRELNSAGRFGVAEQIAMKARIEQLQALAAANKHRPDVQAQLEAAQAEFDLRLSAIPARRAELEAEIARIREMFREVQAAQNSWQDVDFELPPTAVGSQLPPHHTVDPTEEFVSFVGSEAIFSEEQRYD